MTYSMSQLRLTLKERATDFILSTHDDPNRRRLGLFTTYPGSGKSYSLWDILMQANVTGDFRFIYVAPRHNVVRSMCDVDHRSDVPHLYSRNHFDERGKPMCQHLVENPRLARLVKGGRLNVSSMCRTRCDYIKACPLVRTYSDVMSGSSWTGVHAHVGTVTEKLFSKQNRDQYNMMIVDENPFQTMLQTERLDAKFIRHMRPFFDGWDEAHNFLDMAGRVLVGMTPTPVPVVNFNPRKFMKEYNTRMMDCIDKGGIPPPYSTISLVCRILEDVKNGMDIGKMVAPVNNQVRISRFNTELINDVGIPVMALDAGGSLETWRVLASKYDVELVVDEEWRHFNVVHLKGAGNYYLTTWQQCDNHHVNFAMLRHICRMVDGNVIVCCSKNIKTIIVDNLPDIKNMRFAHFMSLTSDNSLWQDASALVIAGRPTLPPEELAATKLVTELDDRIINYLLVESEVMQAIGRLRQSIPETTVFGGNGIFDLQRQQRRGLYIVVFPDLFGDDPFKGFVSYDADAFVRSSRADYMECLQHGYLDPVMYYARKMLSFLIVPRTTTEIKREFANKGWIDQSITRLYQHDMIKKVGQRWVMNFANSSTRNLQIV